MSWLKNLFKSIDISNLPSSEWSNKLKADKNAMVIDVRSPGEFVSGHILKAYNADIFSSQFTSQIQALDPEKTYYVYCRSGKRSMMACKKMHKLGYTKVHNLQGGIMSYKGKLTK